MMRKVRDKHNSGLAYGGIRAGVGLAVVLIGLLLAAGGATVQAAPVNETWQQGSGLTIQLQYGFSPDPHQLTVTAGGSTRASDFYHDCSGWLATFPTQTLYWNGNNSPLKIMARSNADTTLIVMDPNGRYWCSDDAEGPNPMVTFDQAADGFYYIGVGVFGGGTAQATLGISELSTAAPSRLSLPTTTSSPPTSRPSPPSPPTTSTTSGAYGIVTAVRTLNVRSGPDTAYRVVRTVASGTRLPITGRSADYEWWQVAVDGIPGGRGWVSTLYFQTANTADVPVVSATGTTDGGTVSTAPTLDWRATQQGADPIFPTYNRDTVNRSLRAGGAIDVGQVAGLPENCRGFTDRGPDFRLDWLGSGTADLFIYFLAPVDTTLIIRHPSGSWHCDDDGYGNGTTNPLVSFTNARSGVYSVWVGRYGSSTTANGTLYIGEYRP